MCQDGMICKHMCRPGRARGHIWDVELRGAKVRS